MTKSEYTDKVIEVKNGIIKDITKVVTTYFKGNTDSVISFNRPICFADDPYINDEAIISIDTKDNGEIRLYSDSNNAYCLYEIQLEILALIMDKLLDTEAFEIV